MKPSLNAVGSFLSPQVSIQLGRRFLPIEAAALTTPKIYWLLIMKVTGCNLL